MCSSDLNPWRWALQRGMKDALPTELASEVVYRINCSDCDGSYIGETKRPMGVRLKEHRASLCNGHLQASAVAEHAMDTGHGIKWSEATALDSSRTTISRRVKEALWIRREGPRLNRDQGLELSPLWLDLASTHKR